MTYACSKECNRAAVIPLKPTTGLTRISCTRIHSTAACAAFCEESRMKVGEFTKLHRKSGGMGHPPLVAGRQGLLSVCENGSKPQISPLRYPEFLSRLVALAVLMRLSLMKAAHVDLSGAAKQEFGYAPVEMTNLRSMSSREVVTWTPWLGRKSQICHLDRSVAQWRDLRCSSDFSPKPSSKAFQRLILPG